MARRDGPPVTRGVVLRGFGLAIAVGLGAVAVWLIVTGSSRKLVEVGVLAGLWSALIAACALFGARRPPEPVHEPAPNLPARISEIEILARRDFEERLQQLLRREIDSAVTREVSVLRTEITQLRHDLLEKVGGQLKLERIEVTRVIGSDLEALQDEVRQLKSAAVAPPRVHVVEPARTRPALQPVEEIVEPPPPPPPPRPVEVPVPPPPRATEPPRQAEPPPPPPSPRAPDPEPQPAVAVAQAPGAPHAAGNGTAQTSPSRPAESTDPFASLPRITPFTDFELDPIDPPAPPPAPAYSGRRRRDGVDDSAGGGRRRRRDDSDQDSLLAQVLAREGSH